MNTYDNLFNVYDIIYKENEVEIKFYKKFVRLFSDILDMGCGSGRLSMSLAKETHWKTYDCVDLSEPMLSLFKDKINAHSSIYPFYNKLNLINSDMEKFYTDKKYDLIMYPFQSIQSLDRKKISIEICKSKKMLKPNGYLIISGFDPKYGYIPGSSSINGMGIKDNEVYIGMNINYNISDDSVEYDQNVQIFNKDNF